MLKLNRRENKFVVFGKVKMYMDSNDLEGVDDFVKEALKLPTLAMIEVARKYVPDLVETS